MVDLTARGLSLQSGAATFNMALDQAVLESVDQGGPPTLRFYQWSEPTLSLGYFQPLAHRFSHPQSQSLGIVRRSTGGGAIVHHHELTYSVALRSDRDLHGPEVPPASRGLGARRQLYRSVHRAFARTIEALVRTRSGPRSAPSAAEAGRSLASPAGEQSPRPADAEPFLCFQRRTSEDLVVHGYKVLGSAQRRGRFAVLQHGSLLLRASPFAPQLPGLEDLLGVRIDPNRWAAVLAEAIASELGWNLEAGDITPDERAATERIRAERFANGRWIDKR